MARTTLDLDKDVLERAKVVAKRRRKPLGEIISELVARGLAFETSNATDAEIPPLDWPHQPMGSRFESWAEIKYFLEAEDIAAYRAISADNA